MRLSSVMNGRGSRPCASSPGALSRRLALLVVVVLAGCSPGTSVSTASPSPALTASPLASPSPGKVADWPQYHRNAARTGVGPAMPALDQPAPAWRAGVDGTVY